MNTPAFQDPVRLAGREPALLPHPEVPDLFLILLLDQLPALPRRLGVRQIAPLDIIIRVLGVAVRHLAVHHALHNGVAPCQLLLHLHLTLHVLNIVGVRVLFPHVNLMLFLHKVINLFQPFRAHFLQTAIRLPRVVKVGVAFPFDQILSLEVVVADIAVVQVGVGVDAGLFDAVDCGAGSGSAKLSLPSFQYLK